MHTPLSRFLPPARRPAIAIRAVLGVVLGAVVLLLLGGRTATALAGSPPDRGGAPTSAHKPDGPDKPNRTKPDRTKPDTTKPDRTVAPAADTVWTNLRLYPLAAWGPRAGVGGGAGLVIHNVGRAGSLVLLTAAPARHDQSATLTLSSTDDLRGASRFAVLDARARHTDRLWFYGRGPAAPDDQRAALDLSSWNVRLRTGLRRWQDRLLVQPRLRVVQYRLDEIRNRPAEASSRLTAPLNALDGSRAGGGLAFPLTGAAAGADLLVDTRDPPPSPVRGVFLRASAERFTGFGSDAPTFDRFGAEAAGWIPLGGRHRVGLSAEAQWTEPRSGADVPFFLQSTLDGRRLPGYARQRFVANDRFSMHLLYRFPVFTYGTLFAVEGHAGLHAGSVYTDLFDQFEASVSFDPISADPGEPPSPAPLRPAASVGLQAGPIFRAGARVDLAVGVSPEGVSGVRFTVTQPLLRLRQPHHRGWF